MILRDLPQTDADLVARGRESSFLCVWCGEPLPEDCSTNRTTCTRAHNKALSRWRLRTAPVARIGHCESCGAIIDRTGRRGRLPRECDDCKSR